MSTDDRQYADHLLNLVGLHEGLPAFSIRCVDLARCEHRQPGECTEFDYCKLADWLDQVGPEIIFDSLALDVDSPPPFPTNPCFPVPVQAWGWDFDGPLIVFDPRPRAPF